MNTSDQRTGTASRATISKSNKAFTILRETLFTFDEVEAFSGHPELLDLIDNCH